MGQAWGWGEGAGLSGWSSGFWEQQWPQDRLCLGLLNPRRPGQQGCESKCVKKHSGPFTDSSICSHGGSLGAAGHGPLTWKHPQYISFGWCGGWNELQETEPRQGPQSLCAVTHPPLGVTSTWGINSEGIHEGKLQVLKAQEERVQISHTTSHVLQVYGFQCQVTMSVLCPLRYDHHSPTHNRKQSAVQNTLDVLTRDQASVLVSDKSRKQHLLWEN